jgi:hypothetical protein
MMGMCSTMMDRERGGMDAEMPMSPCPMCGGTGMAPEDEAADEKRAYERYRDELRKELKSVDRRLGELS